MRGDCWGLGARLGRISCLEWPLCGEHCCLGAGCEPAWLLTLLVPIVPVPITLVLVE